MESFLAKMREDSRRVKEAGDLIFDEALEKDLFKTRYELCKLWGTLVNVTWHHDLIGNFELSFRVAGGLCAEIQAGSHDIYKDDEYAYMEYYCCTREYDMKDPETEAKLNAMGVTRVKSV
jgi:hypothetical protein